MEHIEDIDNNDSYHEAMVVTSNDVMSLETAENVLNDTINKIHSMSNVTDDNKDGMEVVMATESLKYSVKLLGINDSLLTQPYNISRESFEANPIMTYDLAHEGVKEFLDAVIGTISGIYNKIVNGIKIIIEKIKIGFYLK